VRARVVLERSATQSGIVVDEDGAPVVNAWVHATAEGQQRAPSEREARQEVLTDDRGAFTLSRLSPRTKFSVTARRATGGSVTRTGVQVGDPLTLTLLNGASLQGFVIDEHQQPVVDATIRIAALESGELRSARPYGRDGRFEIVGVSAGSVALSAVAPGRSSAPMMLELAPGQSLSALRLQVQAEAAPSDSLSAPP
jgi:hypothetical protein